MLRDVGAVSLQSGERAGFQEEGQQGGTGGAVHCTELERTW